MVVRTLTASLVIVLAATAVVHAAVLAGPTTASVCPSSEWAYEVRFAVFRGAAPGAEGTAVKTLFELPDPWLVDAKLNEIGARAGMSEAVRGGWGFIKTVAPGRSVEVAGHVPDVEPRALFVVRGKAPRNSTAAHEVRVSVRAEGQSAREFQLAPNGTRAVFFALGGGRSLLVVVTLAPCGRAGGRFEDGRASASIIPPRPVLATDTTPDATARAAPIGAESAPPGDEGEVLIQYLVSTDGRAVDFLHIAGEPGLMPRAVAELAKTRHEPGLDAGKTVPVPAVARVRVPRG